MTGPSEPLAAELADAAEHFAHWRRTRTKRSAPTPLALREQAVALLAAHRPSTVARVLGINTVMLERWSAPSRRGEPSRPPSNFVALPEASTAPLALEPPEAAAPHLPELVLRWPGGAQLLARGPIPPATVRAIVEAFAAPVTDAAPRRRRR